MVSDRTLIASGAALGIGILITAAALKHSGITSSYSSGGPPPPPPPPPGPLSATQAVGEVITQPSGASSVLIDVNAFGGTPPYVFAMTWDDNTVQTNNSGSFIRQFPAAPTSQQGTVIISSADGQHVDLDVTAPF
jgi:hypothetical protein